MQILLLKERMGILLPRPMQLLNPHEDGRNVFHSCIEHSALCFSLDFLIDLW